VTQLVDQRLPLEAEVLEAGQWTPQEAASHVAEAWQNAVESIVETGRRLIEAKQRVGHGRWLDTVALLPFAERQAQRLMAIASHPDLSNTSHATYLPLSSYTLSILAQLPEGEIPKRIEAGEITPELDRATAQAWVSTYSAARQEALNAWSQANDAALHVLSYLKTYGPPPDTDVYVTISEFRRRVLEMATIVQYWEEPSEQ
jgi:hypothetical protein